MKRDFGDYKWSLQTLARRFKELGITCINYEASVYDVKETLRKRKLMDLENFLDIEQWIKNWEQYLLTLSHRTQAWRCKQEN